MRVVCAEFYYVLYCVISSFVLKARALRSLELSWYHNHAFVRCTLEPKWRTSIWLCLLVIAILPPTSNIG